MSKIFKSYNIKIDDENKFKVDSSINQEPELQDEAVESEKKNVGDPSAALGKYIINKSKADARNIVNEAEDKAKNILAKANADAVEILESVREQAKIEGYDQGYSQGVAEAEILKTEAQNLLDNTKKSVDETIKNIEPDMVELIIKITEMLINKIGVLDTSLVVNLVKQGISQMTITGEVIVHVSKEDYDDVVENKDEITALISGSAELQFVKDLSLVKNDCIIETPLGNIDCSLGQQFEGLKNDLYYILENRWVN